MSRDSQAAPSILRSVLRLGRRLALRVNLRHLSSYALLLLGSSFMVIPLIWMVTASFKPQWQIFANPIIWVPQTLGTGSRRTDQPPVAAVERRGRRADAQRDPGRRAALYDGHRRGQTHRPARGPLRRVGRSCRRPIEQRDHRQHPRLDDRWETRQVVAVARGSGENMIVVEVGDWPRPSHGCLSMRSTPATGQRSRWKGSSSGGGGRAGWADPPAHPIGPESELSVVADPGVAADAFLIPAGTLESAGYAEVGATEIALARLPDDTTIT